MKTKWITKVLVLGTVMTMVTACGRNESWDHLTDQLGKTLETGTKGMKKVTEAIEGNGHR